MSRLYPLPPPWVSTSLLPLLVVLSWRGRHTFHWVGGAGGNKICTHWYWGLPGIQAVPAAGQQLSEGQAKLHKVSVHVFLCPGDRGNPKGSLTSSFSKMTCPQVKDEYLHNPVI